MIGRIRESEGINPFKFKESKLDTSLKLNLDFDADIKDGYNIIILAHQPGIGKTYNVLEYMTTHPNSFYFTDRHRAIEEHTSEWKKKNIEYSHWRGFDKICNTNDVNDLYNRFHFTPKDIFAKYNWRDKSKDNKTYSNQFNERVRVFAPFNYLKYDSFKSKLPEIVFIDERISQLEEYHFDAEKLAKDLELINMPSAYIEKARGRRCFFFLEKGVRSEIVTSYKDNVLDALEKNDTERLKHLQNFNPYELDGYVRWGGIYKFNSNVYAVPFYYYAFDALVNGVPIVLLDASFNICLFYYFLESYNGEMKRLKQPGFSDVKANVKIYYSKHKNPKTKIYRMRPTGAWSRSSIVGGWKEKTQEWLSRDMRCIMDVFGQGNVGVISFKDYGEICQSFGFDMEYFGALRGTNLLEDKPVLVIMGGWFPPPHSEIVPKDKREGKEFLDDLVRKYFLRKITKKDIMDVFVGAPTEVESSHQHLMRGIAHLTTEKEWTKGNRPADIVDAHPVSMVNTMFCDEMYQAFHRNRGLRYPRIIFAYCWFPEPRAVYHFRGNAVDASESRVERFIHYNLRAEFDGHVEKVYNQWMEEKDYKGGLKFFEWLATKYSYGKVLKIIREFEKGDERGVSPSNTIIANRYNIWEGPGESVDNRLIEHFRNIYNEVKEKAKVKKKGKGK